MRCDSNTFFVKLCTVSVLKI